MSENPEKDNRVKGTALILEGNLYYNKQEYKRSAETYERAGKWAISHSLSNKAIKEAFWMATNAWISACKIENAFRILENENFEGKYELLDELYSKIEVMVKKLVSNHRMKEASGNDIMEKIKQKLKETKPFIPNKANIKPLTPREFMRIFLRERQKQK